MTGTDGVAAISARMTQIRSLVAGTPLPATSGSGASFEAALAAAVGRSGSSGIAPLFSAGGSSALFSAGSPAVEGLFTTSPSAAAAMVGSSAGSSAVLDAYGVPADLDAYGVPADLAAYGNGRIPASALAPVGTGGERMWAPAAQSLTRLIDAAATDGVRIGVTDGYRTYESQVDLVARKGLYSQGGLAAVPGTSQHGWGLAADLDLDTHALAWMRANGPRFGFVETTPRESWHWEYQP